MSRMGVLPSYKNQMPLAQWEWECVSHSWQITCPQHRATHLHIHTLPVSFSFHQIIKKQMVRPFELFIDDVLSAYGGLVLCYSCFRQWIFAAFTSSWNYCNYEMITLRFYSELLTSNFCGSFHNTRMDPLWLCSWCLNHSIKSPLYFISEYWRAKGPFTQIAFRFCIPLWCFSIVFLCKHALDGSVWPHLASFLAAPLWHNNQNVMLKF